MKFMQTVKLVNALSPQSINGTDTYGNAIDTAGFSQFAFIFQTGTIGAADFDNLAIYESETSGGSYTLWTGSAMTAPLQTQDDLVWLWDLQGGGTHKRYLKIRVDPGAAASLVSAVAVLYNANQMPNTDTERGVAQSLFLA